MPRCRPRRPEEVIYHHTQNAQPEAVLGRIPPMRLAAGISFKDAAVTKSQEAVMRLSGFLTIRNLKRKIGPCISWGLKPRFLKSLKGLLVPP